MKSHRLAGDGLANRFHVETKRNHRLCASSTYQNLAAYRQQPLSTRLFFSQIVKYFRESRTSLSEHVGWCFVLWFRLSCKWWPDQQPGRSVIPEQGRAGPANSDPGTGQTAVGGPGDCETSLRRSENAGTASVAAAGSGSLLLPAGPGRGGVHILLARPRHPRLL